MSPATGLTVVEAWTLDTLHAIGAGPEGPYVNTRRVLDTLFDRHDIAPRPGYQVVCDLARPWSMHLVLIDFNGNYGTPDFGPARARYTEVRLNGLGGAASAAERGEIGALPIGMINGNTHVDGRRPPLDPSRVVAALRAVAAGASDGDVVALVGPPEFASRCEVRGDLARFPSGRPTTLELSARITPLDSGRFRITNLPPDVSNTQVAMALTAAALPIQHVNDASTGDSTAIEVTLEPGADADEAIAAIASLWGIRTEIDVALGRPLATGLRAWIEHHGGGDLEDRLRLIEAATHRPS